MHRAEVLAEFVQLALHEEMIVPCIISFASITYRIGVFM
jgi:hypothetical protein